MMRRKKQELPHEECIQLLQQQKRGFLAVLGDENYPYAIPLNYVYSNNKIYFHSAQEGHMIDSIKKHEKVSFTLINNGTKVNDDWYYIVKSVIIFGKIKILENNEEKHKILTKLGNKYFPSEDYTKNEINKAFTRTQVLELQIEHISGKIVTEK